MLLYYFSFIISRLFYYFANKVKLVTGGDLTEQLKGKPLGETLCIPSVMLRHEGDMFLDNVSTDDVEDILGVPLTVVDTAYAILGL